MTTPQTDSGRRSSVVTTPAGRTLLDWCDRNELPVAYLVDDVLQIEREATEHVLEVAARLLPPTDVDALRVALKEAQK